MFKKEELEKLTAKLGQDNVIIMLCSRISSEGEFDNGCQDNFNSLLKEEQDKFWSLIDPEYFEKWKKTISKN